MDREDIIRMAREAEFTEGDISLFPDTIAHFAALVAAAEREAIAKSPDRITDLHEVQLENSTVYDIEQAYDYVEKTIRAGKARKIQTPKEKP